MPQLPIQVSSINIAKGIKQFIEIFNEEFKDIKELQIRTTTLTELEKDIEKIRVIVLNIRDIKGKYSFFEI